MSETAKKTELLCAEGGSSYVLPVFFIFLCCLVIIISKLIITYFLNLLHFLSPLLITTLFLLFIFTSYNTLIQNNADHHHQKVYNIIFQEAASHFDQDEEEDSQKPVDKFLISVNDNATQDRNPPPEKTLQQHDDMEELFQKKHDLQSCDVQSEEKDQVKEINTDSKIVVLRGSESKTNIKVNDDVVDKECVSRTFLLQDKSSSNKVDEYEKMMSMRSVGRYGSMRVDKEWKKTLACKLFEERHITNNGSRDDEEEGMDLLWEAYEENNNTSSAKHAKGEEKKNNKKLEKKRSVGSAKSSRYKDMNPVKEDDEEEDEEDEVRGGKICCLQALKFSSGKVNLGMGRPNIGKISKAFRGIGWLHHVSTKKGSSPLKPKVVFGY